MDRGLCQEPTGREYAQATRWDQAREGLARVSVSAKELQNVVATYFRAWEGQDPDLIQSVFHEDATYHERVLGSPIFGRAGIVEYWQKKVVESQANISCRHLASYISGDVAIVEWEAVFDDLEDGARKRLREVAILEFSGQLVKSLREYWASERLGPVQP